MGATLNQPSSVEDDGPTGCKLLLRGGKMRHELVYCKYRVNKHRLTPCQQPR